MSMPATEEWFSLSGRRNRKSYIFSNAIIFSIVLLVFFALWFFEAKKLTGTVIFVIFLLPFVAACYLIAAQRLRDMNVTGWLALVWPILGLMPEGVGGGLSLIFLLILCSVPGTIGDNRYGPDPLA